MEFLPEAVQRPCSWSSPISSITVAGDGQSHNIYVRNYAKFIFRYNYSHGAVIGHIVKSRAADNYIYDNRVSNECSDGGFNQAISLTCSVPPAHSTYTLTPSPLTPPRTC